MALAVVIVAGFVRAGCSGLGARLDAGASVVTASAPQIERSGRVREVAGPAPVALGARCVLRVWTASSGRDGCLVRVRCGDVRVYGDDARDDGWNPCAFTGDGFPLSAADEEDSSRDGDPVLGLDLARGSVGIADTGPTGAWRIEIVLDDAR